MIKKTLFRKPKNRLEDYYTQAAIPKDGNALIPCPQCKGTARQQDLELALLICPQCGHHFRMPARQRLVSVCDTGTFAPLFEEIGPRDPLSFPEYAEKLEKAAEESGEKEAVICGRGRIQGLECALFAMEPYFMMGSMGTAVGEKITLLFEYAADQGLPVVGFTLSGGARMQEGILSLMQMAKTSGGVLRHSEAGLLYIVVLTDPTTGGVTASFAMEGDIILAEPGALVAFAGPRVIEQTIRRKLPPGFQRGEFLLEKGFVDAIIPRNEQKAYLGRLLSLHSPGLNENRQEKEEAAL